jgi:hypothetical protein
MVGGGGVTADSREVPVRKNPVTIIIIIIPQLYKYADSYCMYLLHRTILVANQKERE